MSIRRLSTTSITRTGGKSSKLWDQETTLGTYESIATATADSSGQSSFYFVNVPQNYTHLQLRCTVRAVQSQSTPYDLTITVNNANPTSFAYHQLRGDGASVGAASYISDNVFRVPLTVPNLYHTANVYGAAVIDILNYSSTAKNKTLKAIQGYDNNGGSSPAAGWVSLVSSGFFSTSAITSVDIATYGNFAQFSQVSLYGIRGE